MTPLREFRFKRRVSVKLLPSLVPGAGVEPARPLGTGELTVKIIAAIDRKNEGRLAACGNQNGLNDEGL
jgi:hypothetical protein